VPQRVHLPTDVGEAVAFLADDPASVFLAGGTLLMPVINYDSTPFQTLVSARRLPLNTIAVAGGRALIGATSTIADVGRDARLAFLRPVVETIASPPIRNLATVGGNLFAPQPYGDFAVALLALDASVRIASRNGERIVPMSTLLEQRPAPGEIVTSIEFTIPRDGSWFYTKAMRRKLNSAAIVTVAAVIETTDDIVSSARIALGGVGPRPLRASSVEAALLGQPLNVDTVATAAALAVNDVHPFSDAYASAWYRSRVLPVHIRRAIAGA
jgi:CO/xanthine dehydrogenase FAD-binding subunit